MNKKLINLFLLLHLLTFSINNMAHPVTPAFLKSINAPENMTGILFSAMAFALFIFSPIWGQLSDKYGRYILYIAPIGYGISQILFFFTTNIFLLVFFRFVSGAFASGSSTLNLSFLSDQTTENERIKVLGKAALLMIFAQFIGYAIGGYLGVKFGFKEVFLIQGIISILTAPILYFFVKGSKKAKNNIKIQYNVVKRNVQTFRKYQATSLKFIVLLTFFNMFAFNLLTNQINPILIYNYNLPTNETSMYVATYSLIAALISFFAQKILFKTVKVKYKLLLYFSIISGFAGVIAYLFAANSLIVLWIGLTIVTLINTIFVAIIQDLVSTQNKFGDRGELIGINQSAQSLGISLGTLSAGILFAQNYFLPLIAGAIMFFITFIYNKLVLKKELEKVEDK